MAEPGMAHMGTELRMVLRGESRTHRFLRSRLLFLFLATVALDVVATLVMYMLAHDARVAGFDNMGGALFWACGQLTAVSSQMPSAVATGGRIREVSLEARPISLP